jgi:hypothetical protein
LQSSVRVVVWQRDTLEVKLVILCYGHAAASSAAFLNQVCARLANESLDVCGILGDQPGGSASLSGRLRLFGFV